MLQPTPNERAKRVIPPHSNDCRFKTLQQKFVFLLFGSPSEQNKTKKKALFNHAGKIEVSTFDSYCSRQMLQVREQVGEVEHEMCCYANNTYLSPRMKWEASRGMARIYMKAYTV